MKVMVSEDSASPYLANPGRLSDVIAAIQVMSVYKYYKMSFASWADRISGDEQQAERWKAVFLAHPEFFRLDSAQERASLVWRRQFPKRFDVDASEVISRERYDALSSLEKQRISRNPLSPSDIKALMDTAVNLHSRALEHQKDKRWWLPVAIAIFGSSASLVGVLIGASLK